MEVIKWFVVYNFRKYKNFSSKLNLNKFQLNDFQYGYLTSTPNFCSNMQSTIQQANVFRIFSVKAEILQSTTHDINSKYWVTYMK